MKAKYKININNRSSFFQYSLYKRCLWFFWKKIDESDDHKILEEKLKEIRMLPKYYE